MEESGLTCSAHFLSCLYTDSEIFCLLIAINLNFSGKFMLESQIIGVFFFWQSLMTLVSIVAILLSG